MAHLRRSDKETDAPASGEHGFVIATAVIFMISAVVTTFAAPFAASDASSAAGIAFWIASLIAVITFIMLLRAVVELLVNPEVRMRRVMAYGVVIVSAMMVLVWVWEYFYA